MIPSVVYLPQKQRVPGRYRVAVPVQRTGSPATGRGRAPDSVSAEIHYATGSAQCSLAQAKYFPNIPESIEASLQSMGEWFSSHLFPD